MANRKPYDVLVVGARCAGAATAMLLARRGLRVLAVDRASYGSDTLSTHALMRGAVQQLARWGLLDAVRAAGTPPVRTTTFHYGAESVAVPIRPGGGIDALYAPRRTVLDRILADAARDAGAELRFDTALVDLLRDGDGRVRGARLAGRDGGEDVRADIVIGADGVRSNVAALVGAATWRQAGPGAEVLFGYVRDLGWSGYHWAYGPGMTAGSIETNGGECCVFLGCPAGQARGAGDPASRFRRGLAAAFPALAEAVATTGRAPRLRFFAGIRGHLRQAHGPGWALVGDAGYFKDPATAHGITDAFRDAELLARAIAIGGTAAMQDYQHLRDALSLPLFRVTDAIAGFGWTTEGVKAHLSSLAEAMKVETAVMERIAADTPLPPLPAITRRRAAGAAAPALAA